MKKLYYFLFLVIFLSSCSQLGRDKQGDNKRLTPRTGGFNVSGLGVRYSEGGEFDEFMGVKPIYGLQDNYFDVTVGTGFSVAIKIMSLKEHKCIRYAFVPKVKQLR